MFNAHKEFVINSARHIHGNNLLSLAPTLELRAKNKQAVIYNIIHAQSFVRARRLKRKI
jgi:hypothetical protein